MRNVMTLNVRLIGVRVDKIAITLRFAEDNFIQLHEIQDRISNLVHCRIGKNIKPRWYKNNRYPSMRTVFEISRLGGTIEVETGVAYDYSRKRRPYARFEFNVYRIVRGNYSRARFRELMLEILPCGGYEMLCSQGYVNYVEFAVDYENMRPELIDCYHPGLCCFGYFYKDGICKTINIYNSNARRTREIAVYDKSLSDKERLHHIRRGQLLRIEAKVRLNLDGAYRKLRFHELGNVPSPFAGLRIFYRSRIEQAFAADRHHAFLSHVRRNGVQSALANRRGRRRELVINRLDQCEADWWDANVVWELRHDAINEGVALCSS